MPKHLLIFIFACVLFSCSSDKVELIENLVPDQVENTESEPVENPVEENQDAYFTDSFDTNGTLANYITNNESALPNVASVSGRYKAILDDNANNVTLHFNASQGRIDAKLVEFPFEFIARNIGIGTLDDSQVAPVPNNGPYVFCGIQVHDEDFNSINSSHVVLGHRGGTGYTIEGKNTVDGSSSVNDIGSNTVPLGRGDIRIVGNEDKTITVSWQTPNLEYATIDDNWSLYGDTGRLPGTTPTYGNEVYIGLITYAFGQNGIPFVGTCDAIQIKN